MIDSRDVKVTVLPEFMGGVSIEVPWDRGSQGSGTVVVHVMEKAPSNSLLPVVTVRHKANARPVEQTEYVGVLYGSFDSTRDALDAAETAPTIFTYKARKTLRLAPGDLVFAPVGRMGDPETLSIKTATVVELDALPGGNHFIRTITDRA